MADSEIEEIFKFNKKWFCFSCGLKIQLELEKEGDVPEEIWDQNSFTDDEFPYLIIQTELSDSPRNCSKCGAFLFNPLTELGLVAVQKKSTVLSANLGILGTRGTRRTAAVLVRTPGCHCR